MILKNIKIKKRRPGGATAEGPGGKGAQDYVYKPSYHIVIMLNEDSPLGSE